MVYKPIDDSRFIFIPSFTGESRSATAGEGTLTLEFFDWLQATHSPTWLQPYDEALGATVTSGMAGPDSSSVTNVTFGEPGLVASDRTCAKFDASRIVYPKGAVTDRMHQAAGGTLMFWVRADALMGNEVYTILSSSAASSANVGIWIAFEDRDSVTDVEKALRVAITTGVLSEAVYESSLGTSVASPSNAIVPGQIQMFAITHSDAASSLKMYVDGVEVGSFAQTRAYSEAASTDDPTVGCLRPSDILFPHKGELQGLTFVPSVLTAAEITTIYTQSGGPFV